MMPLICQTIKAHYYVVSGFFNRKIAMTPGQGLNPNVASEAASQVRPLGDEVWRTQVRIHPVSSAHIMAEMSLDKTSLFKSYPEIYTNIFPWQLRAAS